MALKELVAEVAIRCASRSISVYDLADRQLWNFDEVLAFLRCEKVPSESMLRDICQELGISPEEMNRLLSR